MRPRLQYHIQPWHSYDIGVKDGGEDARGRTLPCACRDVVVNLAILTLTSNGDPRAETKSHPWNDPGFIDPEEE